MKNIFLISVLLLCIVFGFSQENQLWQGYFSYNSIKDISQSTNQVYAAAENAYFKKDMVSNEEKTISTIEGLSGQNISQIYHSETFKKTIVGHVDGLITIVNDIDGSIINVVDIINKASVPSNKKKINHFMEYQGDLYISTDFGISVYDLKLLEFGDTYYVGSGGSNIEIFQTTIFNGFIYAVANGYGLLKADINNPNLIDFAQWSMVNSGNWLFVEKKGVDLIAVGLSGGLFKIVNDSPVFVNSYSQTPLDMRCNSGYLIVTTQSYVYIYNDQLIEITRIDSSPNLNVNFTCSTVINDKIFIGTTEKGLISSTISNPVLFENTTPNCPDRNRIFAVQSYSSGLWAVYGDYSIFYNPYPLDYYGVSKFDSSKNWTTFPYQDLFSAKSISRIVVNPNNENQVFFSSHYSGLLKFENDSPTTIYNASNSTFRTIAGQVPDDIRVNGSAFDKTGNLWVTNSLVDKELHVLKADGQWQGYALTSLLQPLINSLGRLTIDKNGTKWMATYRGGLVGFNEKYNNRCISISEGQDLGNLPTADVRVAAVDNKNKLWIGTAQGLRVLQNVDSFLTQNQPTTNAIIILEDNVAQELLYEQFITDIVVDGANNKWIGTAGAGVFYISSDGQKTFNIFTKENSPLPSNIIIDIDINAITGEVFIATEGGMVSYKGSSTKGAENLENVFAFPNPVRPEYNGLVSITGLMDKCNVKITDIEGNLVHEAISEGGTIQWDTTALGKYKVASGVYMVFVSSDDGAETKTKKIMIIR
jgi:ligand-binding sensor domain-containing protein